MNTVIMKMCIIAIFWVTVAISQSCESALNVGDFVQIGDGRRYGQQGMSGRNKLTGRVLTGTNDCQDCQNCWVTVRWSNGPKNMYQMSDLQIINT